MNADILVLIVAMVISSVLCIAVRKTKHVSSVMPACTLVLLILCLNLCIPILRGDVIDEGIFWMDPLSAVFMMLVAFVGFLASLYSRSYIGLELDEGVVSRKENGVYYSLLIVFISVMMLTFTVRSMAVVWLGIGATTLVSTFLVGFYSRDESTEAAWK